MEDSFDALISESNETVLTGHLRTYERAYFLDVEPVNALEVTKDVKGPACYLSNADAIRIHSSIASFPRLCGICILHELINRKLYKQHHIPVSVSDERFQAEIRRLWNAGAYKPLL